MGRSLQIPSCKSFPDTVALSSQELNYNKDDEGKGRIKQLDTINAILKLKK